MIRPEPPSRCDGAVDRYEGLFSPPLPSVFVANRREGVGGLVNLRAAPQMSARVTSARESCRDEILRVVTARRPEPLGTSGYRCGL